MTILFESAYSVHTYDPQHSTLISVWKPATEQMTEVEFEFEMRKWEEVSRLCRPRNIYDRCKDFLFTITPENQTWMANLLNRSWVETGVKKYAHVVPGEMICNLAVEQLFEEFHDMKLAGQFEIQHFGSEEQAFAWLYEEEEVASFINAGPWNR